MAAKAYLPTLSLLHMAAGGCGGCALEFDAIAPPAWDELGLRLTTLPRHADLLLVSGCLTNALLRSVDACWAAMAAPRYLVAVGACALDGGPFRGGYAVGGGIGARLPVALAIPGCPPRPAAILTGLRLLLDAIEAGGPATAVVSPGSVQSSTAPTPPNPTPVDPATPPRALLPAAPRHPLAGGDSSAG